MVNKLDIAVISDLHCRHGKESQITTHLYTELPRLPMEHHPVEALKALIAKEQLTSKLLLCPGDLTDKADEQGLISGWLFLKEMGLYLKSEYVTSSVGNHDVKTRGNSPDPYDFLTSFSPDFPTPDEKRKDSFWSKEKNFFVYNGDNFVLLNFNSAYTHTDAERGKEAVITDAKIAKIDSEIKAFSTSQKIKIALFHHHPVQYSNINQEYKDDDLIQRGELLLSKLREHKFDLVIHGHKHLPRLAYFESAFPLFCAGSFSSLQNIKDVSGKNTFHVISIIKEAARTCGCIKTWEFTKGKGWLSAQNESFFPCITGFGFKDSLTTLKQKITNLFDLRKQSALLFSEVAHELNEISYLTPDQQDELSKLLIEDNIEFAPSLKIGVKAIIKQIR